MSAAPTRNKLLATVPTEEREMLVDRATLVPLARRQTLYEPERPILAVYFLVDGVASVLSVMTDGTGVETATIGREGMVGLAVFHGVDATPEQALVQIPGSAYRLDAQVFRDLLPQLPVLDALLHRFSVVMFTIAAQNSGCNRKHAIPARCARWLLMVADRLERADLELTHDFVSQMLGVRRASVTESLAELETRGMIETSRGRLKIVDRIALEGAACECYAIIRGTVDRLLGGQAANTPLVGVRTAQDGVSILTEPFP